MCLFGVVPIFIVSMLFGDRLLALLIHPVQEALRAAGLPPALQQTNVLETFFAYFHVSMVLTFVVASPWILYQLWCFIAPGLYQHERRFVYLLLPMSTMLTILGVLFLYFILLPIVLTFFVGFGSDLGRPTNAVAPMPEGTTLPTYPMLAANPPAPEPGQVWINTTTRQLVVCFAPAVGSRPPELWVQELTKGAAILQQYKVSEWISLFLSLALAFAGAFQMPVVVMLLGWAGIIDAAFMKKYRRHAVFVIAAIAAVVTPADPISMVAMFLPLYLLYELGGILFRLLPADRIAYGRAGKPPDDDDDPETPGLHKKVRELVPNTLQSAGLVRREGPDAGDP